MVWLAAWFPGALVISAVYSESLFLLVSVGAIYAARLGRWPSAGMLGAVAAATRSGGVIVIVPLLIIYWYGPRLDQPAGELVRGLWPRYRARADILWLVLGVPAGLAAYVLYLGLSTGDPTSVFSAQAAWHRSFVPLGGLALGLWSALHGLVGAGRPRPGQAAGRDRARGPGPADRHPRHRDVLLPGGRASGSATRRAAASTRPTRPTPSAA